MDVIIFSGQSNMQGQTECLTECEAVAGAQEYRYLQDALVPLQNPVGEDICYDKTAGGSLKNLTQSGWLRMHVLGASCYGNTNMVPSFCRAYIEVTGREVVAAHCAKGSTVIAQWLPGTDGYAMLVEKAKGAISLAGEGRVFFVWLQGESDAIFKTTKEEYKKSIASLCRALEKDLGVERFGVIRVGRFTGDDRDLEILAAQDEICREDDGFLMLTDITRDMIYQSEYMNPQVAGHFGARGQEKLGDLAGRSLGAYVLATETGRA